ncbi:hypothetical protein F5Y01DRAFT_70490 [Xylaria sp. FL0043]|nr:hypothetical protein F5Y01DRAFT_70490 [Xylaria sp. FL0043]
MADQDMRLRLVVRRNGLPELRLVWHVHLDTNPTISRLLEQLNDQVPLESDHWGLEDYVVELHDSDGTDFECLHYQSVRSVLKPDDRVFIRALDRDDHRRRRVSGRHQVSSDGRHLIDGVPFGRPYLRTVNGRPNVYIPPPKRARYTYTEQEGDGFGTEGGSPVRLLTNGHLHENSQEAPGGSGDTDPNADDSDFTTDDAESSSLSSSVSEPHIGEEEDEEDTVQSEEGGDLDQEVRDLAVENAAFERRDGSKVQVTGLSTLDKLNALRVAFPRAPIDICEKVLVASNGNLKKTYSVLSEGFRSQVPWETVIAQGSRKGNPRGDLEESRASISSAPFETTHTPVARKRKFREESITYDSDKDEDRNNQDSLWRKYGL